jgi:hypothetical protein
MATKRQEPILPDLFGEAWAAYPKRPGNNRQAAVEAWNARVREGVDPALMLSGTHAYAKYLKANPPSSPSYIKQAATFYGPKLHFTDDYGMPEAGPVAATGAEADLMKFYNDERLI